MALQVARKSKGGFLVEGFFVVERAQMCERTQEKYKLESLNVQMKKESQVEKALYKIQNSVKAARRHNIRNVWYMLLKLKNQSME